MNPFTVHEGRVVAMDRANVDTDQIIPKQFLKRIERTGFGQFLFYDWRFLEDGSDNPDFELNQPAAAGASVLLAKRNFGCGSSVPTGVVPAAASRRHELRRRVPLPREGAPPAAQNVATIALMAPCSGCGFADARAPVRCRDSGRRSTTPPSMGS